MTTLSISERTRLAWVKRRERHGPSGGNHGQGLTQYRPGVGTHGTSNTYHRTGCRCLWCCEAYARRCNSTQNRLLLVGQILPDDFDDDTRIAEAVLRYHPPRAWMAT
jgi:hypothetical protein